MKVKEMNKNKLDGSDLLRLESIIGDYAEKKGLEGQEKKIKNYVINTIYAIINDEKFGSDFVPETDGLEIIKRTLPIQEAIDEGKESTEYKIVATAYKIAEQYILQKVDEMGTFFIKPGTYKSHKKLTLDELDSFGI